MKVEDVELLEKIIEMQSCVIEGYGLKAILRKQTAYLKEKSGANIIAICMENDGHVNIELVLDEEQRFLSLIRKYKLLPKHMDLNQFIEQCNSHFKTSTQYIHIESLYDIFHGTLSKVKILSFEKELDFESADIFPLRSKAGKKIGFIIYIFKKDFPLINTKLTQLTQVFETLIRPFYNDKLHVLHYKCVQVDSNNMQRLTDKEKMIVQRVLHGKSHKEITVDLDISINTLKTHIKNIYSKYGVASKMELNNKIMKGY
jgi:DNA-binding CsgD family transcriptional regulator